MQKLDCGTRVEMADKENGKAGAPKPPPVKQTRFAEDEIAKEPAPKKAVPPSELQSSRTMFEDNSNSSPDKKKGKKEEVREIGEWDDRLKIAGDGDTHQANLKLEYLGFMTHTGFFATVRHLIDETNKAINPEKHIIKQMPDKLPPIESDLVFKYKATLYGVTWT